MKNLILFLLFALPQLSPVPPGWVEVHYKGSQVIPRWPHPPTLTIVYENLYPGERGRPERKGGCMFRTTPPNALILVVEDKPDHITVKAPRGREVEWECSWEVRLKGDPRLGKEETQ